MTGPYAESQVRLDRDALSTPWGVRLQGGRDFKTALTVQRVFVGSPADGELHRGDILVSIENYDANGLSHKQAQDIFKNAGGSISLRIRRAAGLKSVGAVAAPSAPAPWQPPAQNQSYRSRPLDTTAPKPTPPLGAFNPAQSSKQMPLYGGSGPSYGVDYGAHAGAGDPMLNRVQATLNEALWTPHDAQGEADDRQFHSVRDARRQFQQPAAPPSQRRQFQQPAAPPSQQSHAFQRSTDMPDSEEPPEPVQSVDDLTKHFRTIIKQTKAEEAASVRSRAQQQSAPSGGGKKWRRPDNMGGPGCLTEPGWAPKPKSSQYPAWSPTNPTPATPPARIPVNAPNAYDAPPQQPPQQRSARPAWAGTLRGSGGPKPWEVQAGESLVPPGEETAQQYQAPSPGRGQPTPQQVPTSPGGATVVPHKPRVQSMHYGPGGSAEYRQNDPDAGASDTARVVHSQYNTPLGLYSKQNVNDMLQAQTAGMPGQGTMQVTGGDGKKVFNPAQSDVYRLLQEEEEGRGRGRPQSARYQAQTGPEMQYDGYQDQSLQSPSMQALESRYGGAEEFGTSDF